MCGTSFFHIPRYFFQFGIALMHYIRKGEKGGLHQDFLEIGFLVVFDRRE